MPFYPLCQANKKIYDYKNLRFFIRLYVNYAQSKLLEYINNITQQISALRFSVFSQKSP